MSLSDPLGDMLTRIRNGQSAKFAVVEVLPSKLNISVLKVLEEEGYINSFTVSKENPTMDNIQVELRYHRNAGAIMEIKRVSKPGKRVYRSIAEIKNSNNYNGLGVMVLSTSRGVISDRKAIENNVGGEVLFKVF